LLLLQQGLQLPKLEGATAAIAQKETRVKAKQRQSKGKLITRQGQVRGRAGTAERKVDKSRDKKRQTRRDTENN
jgi:hypothetical protein